MLHPDIEMAMQTGYPSNEYLDFERGQASHDSLDKVEYDDFKDFFKVVLPEEK